MIDLKQIKERLNNISSYRDKLGYASDEDLPYAAALRALIQQMETLDDKMAR